MNEGDGWGGHATSQNGVELYLSQVAKTFHKKTLNIRCIFIFKNHFIL